jgi:hypothetical protein
MRAAGSVLGALGLFGTRVGELSDADLLVAQTLAHIASVAIVQERSPTPSSVIPHLRSALVSRVLVEQAKGYLSERLDVSVAEAFVLLRRYARSSDGYLTEVARHLIDDAESRAYIVAAVRDVADLSNLRPLEGRQEGCQGRSATCWPPATPLRPKLIRYNVVLPELVLGRGFWSVVGRCGQKSIRKRQLQDRPQRQQVLAGQRARRIWQIVCGTYVFHPPGDRGVPIAGQIRKDVMLDLVAEVAAHEGHGGPRVEVRRPQHLAQIPSRFGLTLQCCRGELLGAVREVPARNHHIRPHIAQDVGRQIGRQRPAPPTSTEQREERVVLA